MRHLIAGIKRKEHYSSNHRTNDALILKKTAAELEKLGINAVIYSEEEFVSTKTVADLYFSMGRDYATLDKLVELEKEGAIVINSPESSYNCHRVNMIQKMIEADVTIPKSLIVQTDSNILYKLSAIGKDKIWLKRGDVHAIHREDVTLVYSDEQLNFVLKEFNLRGIKDAVLQEHIEGDVVKFYSVINTDFFHWYYLDGKNKYKFDLENRNNIQPGEPVYDSIAFDPQQFDFFKKLIALRKNNPVLMDGDFNFLKTEGKILVYSRTNGTDEIMVLFNLGDTADFYVLPEKVVYSDLMNGGQWNGKMELPALSGFILKKEK